MSAENLDLILGWASLVLTLFIFSYLLADTVLYRVGVSLLVGVTAGYMAIVAVESVILPWLDLTILAEDSETALAVRAIGVIPFLIGIFLIIKQLPNISPFGNPGVAFIIGVGTAVSIVGAVVGTLLPLMRDTSESFDRENFFNGLVLVVGTLSTLVYFQYLAKRNVQGQVSRSLPMRIMATLGKGFVAVTFGAIYAGMIMTSLSILSGVIAQQLALFWNDSPMRSFVVTDFGIAFTRTILLDVVEGEYRLIAGAKTRTTAKEDVVYGFVRNLEQIQTQTGRKLWADALISPTQPDGSGFDEFLATASSAGRPLRAVLVGVMEDFSLASARRALTGTYVEAVQTLSLGDSLSEEQRINRIIQAEPDVIFIVGGTNEGNEAGVRALIDVVETATKLVPTGFRPIVLYAGNERLRHYARARLAEHCIVLTADNLRPSVNMEALASAKAQLARVFDSFLRRQPGGFSDIAQFSDTGITPTAQSAGRLVRYLDALQPGGAAYVDVGSGTSTLIASMEGFTLFDIRSQLGLGFHVLEVLRTLDWRDVERWLPFSFSLETLEEWAYNKAMSPASVPQTLRDTFIEYAVTREIVRLMWQDARERLKAEGYRTPNFVTVVAAGAALTDIPPRLAALVVLDALEVTGACEIWLDPYALTSALGVVGEREPSAVVQVIDNGGFAKLGMAFCPSGRLRGVRSLRARMRVKITLPTGKTLEKQLSPGDFWIPEIAPALWVEVEIRLSRGLEINGKRRLTQRVQTGAAGLIFDLRGRPLNFGSGRRRRAKMAEWFSHTTGVLVDESLLDEPEIALDEAPLIATSVGVADEDFPDYRGLADTLQLDPALEELLQVPAQAEDDPFGLETAGEAPSDYGDLRKDLGL